MDMCIYIRFVYTHARLTNPRLQMNMSSMSVSDGIGDGGDASGQNDAQPFMISKRNKQECRCLDFVLSFVMGKETIGSGRQYAWEWTLLLLLKLMCFAFFLSGPKNC